MSSGARGVRQKERDIICQVFLTAAGVGTASLSLPKKVGGSWELEPLHATASLAIPTPSLPTTQPGADLRVFSGGSTGRWFW